LVLGWELLLLGWQWQLVLGFEMDWQLLLH
jgi:hypothetical protein